MTTTRPFTTDDLFRFGRINLDLQWTETYQPSFYLKYLATWPDICVAQDAPGAGGVAAYLLAKTEGTAKLWHGHVTAITVAPEFRRVGCARRLMRLLEKYSDERQCYFVDLFVRKSNRTAIDFYEKLGFSVYREIREYYSGPNPENAFDMRKALSKDVGKESVVPVGRIVTTEEIEFN